MARRRRNARMAALADAAGAGNVPPGLAGADVAGSDVALSDTAGTNPLAVAADLLEAAMATLPENIQGEVKSIVDRLRSLSTEALQGPPKPEEAEPKEGTLVQKGGFEPQQDQRGQA